MRKLGSHQDVMAAKVGIFSIECLESESCAILTVIVTVGTVIGCSAKTKFCQMAPKSTENH